ncbi:hypothetical protein AAF712_015006 [Marasmius tenuissimus]|uniref:Uncharacterized protein n=1 Tax=Marasmius tenuissimus TaxID=585030 RepID=A0ABR2ZC07_9AGAR
MPDTIPQLAAAISHVRIPSTIGSNFSTSEFAQHPGYGKKTVRSEANDVNCRLLFEDEDETLGSQTRTCAGSTEKEKELITLTEVEVINPESTLGLY